MYMCTIYSKTIYPRLSVQVVAIYVQTDQIQIGFILHYSSPTIWCCIKQRKKKGALRHCFSPLQPDMIDFSGTVGLGSNAPWWCCLYLYASFGIIFQFGIRIEFIRFPNLHVCHSLKRLPIYVLNLNYLGKNVNKYSILCFPLE